MEVRRYPPSKFCPKNIALPKLGSEFYLCCQGEIWASAKLCGLKEFHSLGDFELFEECHQVTSETCPGSGPTSYHKLSRTLREEGGGLFGWKLEVVKTFLDRPRGGHSYRGIPIPEFNGQKHGQVWVTSELPLL